MKKTSVTESSELKAHLDTAEEHLEKSEYALAETLANEFLSHSNKIGTLPLGDEARALCILGDCCRNTARFDDAFTYFQNALTVAKAASNLGLQSRALGGTANVQVKLSDYNTALGTAEHALALAEQTEDKKRQAKLMTTVGLIHLNLADSPRALDWYARTLLLNEEIGDKSGVIAILNNIGLVHLNLADYPRALDQFTRALALAEEIDDKAAVTTILSNIGNVHASLANYSVALDYFTRALPLAEAIGAKEAAILALGNIGNVLVQLTDYPRSLDYLSRALAIAEEIGDQYNVAVTLGNMGLSYINTGDYTRALEYLQRALMLSKQIDARRTASYWMLGIAKTQRKLGNHNAAAQGFLDTLHHRRNEVKTNEGVAETLLELGGVLLAQGKTEDGLARLMESLQLADELGEKEIGSEAHNQIADAYAKTGDAAKELEHLKKHYALEKEIFSEESKKRVELFNMRVAVAEIEHGVEVQKLRGERMEHEISSQAIHLAAQTELVDKFRNDLRQIIREIDEPIAALKKIKEKLKELPCQQIDWPKFEVQFNEVHPEFREKLTAKFPDLTHMEQRIAAMVRMDLTSSDIARLFCITERAVEFHRLNLRKKLELKKEDSLPKFLTGI